MSDAGDPTGAVDADPDDANAANDAPGDAAGEFDPVDVFEGGEMDLRPGADDCYKCSTCDTACPVAAVDDEFPGPKFQGPEQWRLKRRKDADIDPSVMDCSNCMRCDGACPAGVPLRRMHNVARAAYVDEQLPTLSRTYLRAKLLANYGRLGRLGARFPRLANLLAGSRLAGWLGERLLGITDEREFPAFARQTFREWWEERGGAATSKRRARAARVERSGHAASEERARAARTAGGDGSGADAGGDTGDTGDASDTGAAPNDREKRVAYFHGDYADYNTPGVAKALVRVFEHYGYAVRVPEQRCSGTPMFANGMLDDARRAARHNVETFHALVEEGYDVVCSCTSCSMALRGEYPELFDFEGTDEVAASTYDALEYLRIHEDLAADLADAEFGEAFAYHAPCHARNQGLGRQAVELLGELDGAAVADVGDSCSGISGTYGWKAENYETSMAIGEEMFEGMREAPGETGLTECPTCAMQMEHGTGYEVRHPLEVVEAALVDGGTRDGDSVPAGDQPDGDSVPADDQPDGD